MMPRKKKDPDVKILPDDVDDEDALLGEDVEDEPEPEPEPDVGPKEDAGMWKQKYYDAERSKSEVASEYRQKINQLQEELRKSRLEKMDKDGGDLDGDERATAPVSRASDTDERPPYRIVKWVQERAMNGQAVMVPREIPGLSYEDHPRAEDLPLQIILNWGPGEYKVRDGRGKIVGGFNITPAGAEGAPGMGMGAPPAINPANANIGQFMMDPMQRALNLFDEGKKRGDDKLMARAGQLMDRAMEGGGGGMGELEKTLGLLKALNDYSAQARALVMPPGGFPGSGGVEDKEVALKRLEMEVADKKWAGVERIISGVTEKAEGIVERVVKELKAPEANKEQVKNAAQRLGGASAGARFIPANQPPYPPASPPPPQAPPRPKTVAPPGTVVKCGGCSNDFTINDFLSHVHSCPGGGQPAAPQGTPMAAPQTPGGRGMPELHPELKTYLGLMRSLTNYIVAFNDGDNDASPEAVGKTVWLGVSVPGKDDDKAKLLSIVDTGYDRISNREDLNNIVKGLDAFPNFTPEQTAMFIEAAVVSGIMRNEEVEHLEDVGDLGPALDEFKNHIAIQQSPKGREWICRLLNAVAIKAGRPAPHADFLPGAQGARRGGADNL